MDFHLTKEQLLVRKMYREFAENEVKPLATEIDEEVKRIIDECYQKAKEIILEYRDVLDSSSALLIEREKIGQEEFEALFDQKENDPESFFKNHEIGESAQK